MTDRAMGPGMALLRRGLIALPPGRPRWICPTSSQFDLLYLGWGSRSWGRYRIPPAYQDGWHYLLILKGAPVLTFEQGQLSLSKGSLVISHPDCAIGIVDENGARADHLCWVWRGRPHATELIPERNSFLQWKLEESLFKQLQQLMAACRHEIGRMDRWTKQMIESLHFSLDTTLIRSLGHAPQSTHLGSRLELAIHWMQAHLSSQEFVTSLCDYLQVSPSTLGRMYEKHLKESPSSHFQRLKMERASELLKSGKMTVKEIAYYLGYRHANDFSRAFKSYTRKRPSLILAKSAR